MGGIPQCDVILDMFLIFSNSGQSIFEGFHIQKINTWKPNYIIAHFRCDDYSTIISAYEIWSYGEYGPKFKSVGENLVINC